MTVPFIPPLEPVQPIEAVPQPAFSIAPPEIPQPAASAPPTPLSIWDRIRSGLQQLGPNVLPVTQNEAQLGGLTPEDIDRLRNFALMRMGASLLSSKGALAPALGEAIATGQDYFQGLINQAFTRQRQIEAERTQKERLALDKERFAIEKEQAATEIEQRKRILEGAARLEEIRKRYAPREYETPRVAAQRLFRMWTEMLGIPGAEQQTSAIAGLLAANSNLLDEEQLRDLGLRPPIETVDENGKPITVILDKAGNIVHKFPAPPAGLSPTQLDLLMARRFQKEDALINDYKTLAGIPDQMQRSNYYRMAKESSEAALRGDPYAQYQLVINFLHTGEPTSIVREGEFANVARRIGASDRVVRWLEDFKYGTILSPAQVRSILSEMERMARANKKAVDSAKQQIQRRAQTWGLDLSDALFDPWEDVLTAPQAQQPSSNKSSLLQKYK